MIQQLLALFIVFSFLGRLILQKKRKKISAGEFIFWLVFWFLVLLAVVFLKYIDFFVASLGFSASGIDVLIYLAVAILFYFVFRLRIKLEKIERDITSIVREISLKDKK